MYNFTSTDIEKGKKSMLIEFIVILDPGFRMPMFRPDRDPSSFKNRIRIRPNYPDPDRKLRVNLYCYGDFGGMTGL